MRMVATGGLKLLTAKRKQMNKLILMLNQKKYGSLQSAPGAPFAFHPGDWFSGRGFETDQHPGVTVNSYDRIYHEITPEKV